MDRPVVVDIMSRWRYGGVRLNPVLPYQGAFQMTAKHLFYQLHYNEDLYQQFLLLKEVFDADCLRVIFGFLE